MRGIKHIKINSCNNCGNCSDCCTEYSESYSDLNRCGTGGDPNHDHDNRYYTKTQIDNSFYTKDQIDENHYTKDEVYNKDEVYTKNEINNGDFLNGLNALVFWSALKEYKEGDRVVILTEQSETHYQALQDNINITPASNPLVWDIIFQSLDYSERLDTKIVYTDRLVINPTTTGSENKLISFTDQGLQFVNTDNNSGFALNDYSAGFNTEYFNTVAKNIILEGHNSIEISVHSALVGFNITENGIYLFGDKTLELGEEPTTLNSLSLVHKKYVDDRIFTNELKAGRNIQLEDKFIHLNALGVPSTLLMLTDTGALNNANGYLRIREADSELRGKNASSLTIKGSRTSLTGPPIMQAKVELVNDVPEFAVLEYDAAGSSELIAKFSKNFSKVSAKNLDLDFIMSTAISSDPDLDGLPITLWKYGVDSAAPQITIAPSKMSKTETGTGDEIIRYVQIWNNGGAFNANPNEVGLYRGGGRILIVEHGGLLIRPGHSNNNLSITTEDENNIEEKSFLVTAGPTSGLFYELDTHRIDLMDEEKQNKFIPSVGDVKELLEESKFNIGGNLFLDENNNLSLGTFHPSLETVVISSTGSNSSEEGGILMLTSQYFGVAVSSGGKDGTLIFSIDHGLHYETSMVPFEDLLPTSLMTLQHANELTSLKKDGDGFTLDILEGVTEHLPTGRGSLNLQRNLATTQGVGGEESMVIGRSNTLYGSLSLMAGSNNTVEYQSLHSAGAQASLVFGYKNTLGITINSIVGGENNKVSAPSSGYSFYTSNSIVLGNNNTVSGINNGVVIGSSNNVVNSTLCYILGHQNSATLGNKRSIILGIGNTIGGGNVSVGIGEGLTTAGAYGVTVGYHNDASEALTTGGGAPVVFQIGAGSHTSSKKNALSVDYVGNTHINSLYIRNKANTAWNRLDILDSLPTFTNTAIATGMHYMEVIGALQGQIDDLKSRLDTLEG